MTTCRRRFSALVTCLAMATSLGRAQSPTAPQPTFRSGVEYVEVDVRVTDRNGALVRDLTGADFEVREDGKLQRVETLSLIEIPIVTADSSLHRSASSGNESPVRSNDTPFDGRIYILILDDLHTTERWSDLVRSIPQG